MPRLALLCVDLGGSPPLSSAYGRSEAIDRPSLAHRSLFGGTRRTHRKPVDLTVGCVLSQSKASAPTVVQAAAARAQSGTLLQLEPGRLPAQREHGQHEPARVASRHGRRPLAPTRDTAGCSELSATETRSRLQRHFPTEQPRTAFQGRTKRPAAWACLVQHHHQRRRPALRGPARAHRPGRPDTAHHATGAGAHRYEERPVQYRLTAQLISARQRGLGTMNPNCWNGYLPRCEGALPVEPFHLTGRP